MHVSFARKVSADNGQGEERQKFVSIDIVGVSHYHEAKRLSVETREDWPWVYRCTIGITSHSSAPACVSLREYDGSGDRGGDDCRRD